MLNQFLILNLIKEWNAEKFRKYKLKIKQSYDKV